MDTPNTAQATGPLTLEQGFAQFKAKLAEKGTPNPDLVMTEEPIEGEDPILAETEEPATEEAEAVSEGASTAEEEILPDTGKIILPDGSTITAEEARKGYLRQADFTKKTQEVARERETLAFEKQAAVQQISGLYQQLASLQETEPNWLQLAQTVEPYEYQRQQAYWTHKNNVMAQTRQIIQQTENQRLQAERAKAFQDLNSGEFEPAWKDSKVLQAGLTTVSEYLIDQGLPAEILDGITNTNVIKIAEKARRYDELQKQKPKAALAVKGKPAPFKPGAKSTASPQSENIRLLQDTFLKNPSPQNAAALQTARDAARRK
jgi:hypothetical protein